MNESLNDHQVMVRTLVKAPELIIASLDGKKAHLMHMAIGIGDEYFEYVTAVTMPNKVEELGDLLFYIEGLIALHFDEVTNQKEMLFDPVDTSMINMFACVKRHVFYEQEINISQLAAAYYNLIEWVRYEANLLELNLEDIREANMAKLGKRYVGFKYTNERAKDRVDKIGTDEEES